ncbi:MAG: phosphotransferase [Pseudomonadota bacterium]
MHNHSPEPAASILAQCGWIESESAVRTVEPAGDGNMNLVERVTLNDGQSLILKRAHPWVQKFPDIPAPIERAAVEAGFFSAIAGTDVARGMPAHLRFNESRAANLFEDLGEGQDGSHIYQTGRLDPADLAAVASWLARLHNLAPPGEKLLQNAAMRQLNAVHIFDFPLDSANGFDLDAITPRLQRAADKLKRDDNFRDHVSRLKGTYLTTSDGVLLHGDMHPASWLNTAHGIRIIDPEFCWIGPPEWDLGILVAHLVLAGQEMDAVENFYASYGRPVDRTLADRFTGVEIMRRLIGVAQIPVTLDADSKGSLLERARELVVAGG